MYDIISIGSATLDVFLRSKGLEIEKENGAKEICVRYGAKISVDELYFESGGGGTNTAVTFARQGLKVASIVKVGDDFAGEKIKRDLEKEGIDIKKIVTEIGGLTDYSTILWAPDGGRTILVYRGKTKLEEDEISFDQLETKWFYVTSVEGNFNVIEKCVVHCMGSGIKVAWNPGMNEIQQKEILSVMLNDITLLNLNKEEMAEVLGVEVLKVNDLLKKAQELPCEYVVITDDRNGSYLHKKRDNFWWHCGIFEDVPKYESTGAGDAFGSGLVTGFIKELSINDCLKLATANASSVVSRVGAKKGILKAQELNNWLKKDIRVEKVEI